VDPKEHCRKFINQAGVLVRDHVPISIPEWHKPKNAGPEASYVNDTLKKILWESLLTHFSLPEDMTEGQKKKVKKWTLKKMAT
jgi:predicted secreted Zn-dependent protease